MKTYTDKTSNERSNYPGGADPLHPLRVLFQEATR